MEMVELNGCLSSTEGTAVTLTAEEYADLLRAKIERDIVFKLAASGLGSYRVEDALKALLQIEGFAQGDSDA